MKKASENRKHETCQKVKGKILSFRKKWKEEKENSTHFNQWRGERFKLSYRVVFKFKMSRNERQQQQQHFSYGNWRL